MSIEVWQYPDSATGENLCQVLTGFGFQKFDNYFQPGPPGTTGFFWAAPDDFKSTSGVDASVVPLNAEWKEALSTQCDWVLRIRTSIWASSFDVEMQNAVVRRVRQEYGGHFHNDHCGRNRYTPITREPSTPASRGVYALRRQIDDELGSLEYCLPREVMEGVSFQSEGGTVVPTSPELLKIVKANDPARVLYNALVPFLVASIEHFFRGSFEILLKYSPDAQRRLAEQTKKVTYSEVMAISRGDVTPERIASNGYSFQNLDNTQKAYKEILKIDVRKALRRRKKVREKLPLLHEAVESLIQARHGVVHHFAINRGLDRDQFLDLLHLVRALVDLVSAEISQSLGTPLGPG